MKVLFLDVDGVLNSADTIRRYAMGIDPLLALLVKRVIVTTGSEIVLSSSWRLIDRGRELVDQQVGKFVDVTPDLRGLRGDEIKAWLTMHPEVEKYAILDDDDDMLPEQLPNFFQTSRSTGITEKIAIAIENHLGSRVRYPVDLESTDGRGYLSPRS
jgi:hypothetical protein